MTDLCLRLELSNHNEVWPRNKEDNHSKKAQILHCSAEQNGGSLFVEAMLLQEWRKKMW